MPSMTSQSQNSLSVPYKRPLPPSLLSHIATCPLFHYASLNMVTISSHIYLASKTVCSLHQTPPATDPIKYRIPISASLFQLRFQMNHLAIKKASGTACLPLLIYLSSFAYTLDRSFSKGKTHHHKPLLRVFPLPSPPPSLPPSPPHE